MPRSIASCSQSEYWTLATRKKQEVDFGNTEFGKQLSAVSKPLHAIQDQALSINDVYTK